MEADVGVAHVVADDDDDVGLFGVGGGEEGTEGNEGNEEEQAEEHGNAQGSGLVVSIQEHRVLSTEYSVRSFRV